VVNDAILAQEGFALPKGHLRKQQLEHLSVEEIYHQLKAQPNLRRPHLSSSQLGWRAYLWRFLVHTPTDFQGFDRRFIGQGLYLDALAGEKLRVFIAVDTSGSIGVPEIAQFLGEVQAILGAYPHLEATFYYADALC
jgi:predicted metal-dependent peptidase